MRTLAMLCALLAGALVAAPVQAQQPGQGFFGISYAGVRSDGASPYGNTTDDRRVPGAKLYGGKMWSRWGMELGYYNLGEYDVEFGNTKFAETQTHALAVSGVLVVPITGAYNFHAKAGLAFTQHEMSCRDAALCAASDPQVTESTKRGVSGLIGIGASAQVGQNVSVRLDWEHIGNVKHQTGNLGYRDSYDLFSVSLQFAF